MLHRVQARHRFEAIALEGVEVGSIGLYEAKAFDVRLERSYVDHLDLHEHEEMRDEAVDARADVHVTGRPDGEDLASGPQVLVKIVPGRSAGLALKVIQYRVQPAAG